MANYQYFSTYRKIAFTMLALKGYYIRKSQLIIYIMGILHVVLVSGFYSIPKLTWIADRLVRELVFIFPLSLNLNQVK